MGFSGLEYHMFYVLYLFVTYLLTFPRNCNCHPISCGMRQISVLAPTLFLIYFNGTPDRLDTQLSLYAIDTTVLTKDTYPSIVAQ
jgi:hypothetical protein